MEERNNIMAKSMSCEKARKAFDFKRKGKVKLGGEIVKIF